MEFSSQEYWCRLPLPQPGVDPEIELMSLAAPELASGFFTTSTTWEAHEINYKYTCILFSNLEKEYWKDSNDQVEKK